MIKEDGTYLLFFFSFFSSQISENRQERKLGRKKDKIENEESLLDITYYMNENLLKWLI